ncbi:hypothetical protein ACIA7S_28280 [Streptomyces sp. NPDC051643]|uniref:hypothetical protein n=1 Tax=Streptomyces sp. NPDC051643 TaxID=3365665 RepID=UPI003790E33F
MATPLPLPAVLPAQLACVACGGDALVSWQRRPTETEVADVVAAEKDRRAERLLLADPDLPPPEFGPLPTADGMTRTVYACGQHAIDLDAAALVHTSSCTAPNPANLPGCDCTPETPPHEPLDDEPMPLPEHWITSA